MQLDGIKSNRPYQSTNQQAALIRAMQFCSDATLSTIFYSSTVLIEQVFIRHDGIRDALIVILGVDGYSVWREATREG